MNKLKYEEPLIDIIEVKIERGFAQSNEGTNFDIDGWGSEGSFGGDAE